MGKSPRSQPRPFAIPARLRKPSHRAEAHPDLPRRWRKMPFRIPSRLRAEAAIRGLLCHTAGPSGAVLDRKKVRTFGSVTVFRNYRPGHMIIAGFQRFQRNGQLALVFRSLRSTGRNVVALIVGDQQLCEQRLDWTVESDNDARGGGLYRRAGPWLLGGWKCVSPGRR